MPEPRFDGIPDPLTDNTFSAINEQLEARSDRMSHDFGQYISDLETARARATTPAREGLVKEHVLDLAAFAHEVVAAAKKAGVTDEQIENGVPDEE